MKPTKFDIKSKIKELLSEIHPSEAIEIIESVGKDLRKKK